LEIKQYGLKVGKIGKFLKGGGFIVIFCSYNTSETQ